MSKYKNFNKVFFYFLLVIIILLAIFNYIINPYEIFSNKFLTSKFSRTEEKKQERSSKFIKLKLNKKQVDTLFIGASRTDYGIDTDYYESLNKSAALNMGIKGLFLSEYKEILDSVLLIHPEIKNVYVGLTFNHFDKRNVDINKYRKAEITKNKNLTLNEIAFAFVSYNSTIDSIKTVIKNIMKRKNQNLEKFNNSNIKIYAQMYDNVEIDENAIFYIEELINICKNKNINIYFYMLPSHITELYLIFEGNSWKQYEEWKRQVVSVSNVFDFQYPKIRNIDNDDDYYDTTHIRYNLGHDVIDSILGIKTEYGRILTKENVNKYLEEDKSYLIKYFSDNKKFVEWMKIQV